MKTFSNFQPNIKIKKKLRVFRGSWLQTLKEMGALSNINLFSTFFHLVNNYSFTASSLHAGKDSNPNERFWRPSCYRYITNAYKNKIDKVPDPCTTVGTFSLISYISWSSILFLYSGRDSNSHALRQ